MNSVDIAIVDYQMGNLRSVQKALEQVGYGATITGEPEQIAQAKKIVLPGVGAFGDAIGELHARDLAQPICDSIRAGKPFLGICLGLQMLFDVGYEGGEHAGLSILPGGVTRFAPQLTSEFGLKVPHMGWNRIEVARTGCPLLKDIQPDAHFYFVHSYFVAPTVGSQRWLNCDYGGQFCAAVWQDNLFATQFHPEKSQRDGLQMLRNFAEL